MPQDWDETWMQVARQMAKRSRCDRGGVGCVIVTPRNRIVATGYTGPPAGFKHLGQSCTAWCPRATERVIPQHYHNCVSVHAESNALMWCDRDAREGGTIYVSSAICMDCGKLIANSGLQRVVFDVADALWRDPAQVAEFMVTCGLDVELRA